MEQAESSSRSCSRSRSKLSSCSVSSRRPAAPATSSRHASTSCSGTALFCASCPSSSTSVKRQQSNKQSIATNTLHTWSPGFRIAKPHCRQGHCARRCHSAREKRFGCKLGWPFVCACMPRERKCSPFNDLRHLLGRASQMVFHHILPAHHFRLLCQSHSLLWWELVHVLEVLRQLLDWSIWRSTSCNRAHPVLSVAFIISLRLTAEFVQKWITQQTSDSCAKFMQYLVGLAAPCLSVMSLRKRNTRNHTDCAAHWKVALRFLKCRRCRPGVCLTLLLWLLSVAGDKMCMPVWGTVASNGNCFGSCACTADLRSDSDVLESESSSIDEDPLWKENTNVAVCACAQTAVGAL